MKRSVSCAATVLSAVFLGFAAAPALADGSKFYVQAGAGVSTMDSTTVASIGAPGSYEDSDAAYRVGFGMKMSDNLAAEFSVHGLGEFGDLGTTYETIAGTGWLIGMAPLTDTLSVQAKVGISIYRADVGPLSDNGHGISIGLGVGARVASNVDVTFDYERMQAKIFAGKTSFDVYSVGAKFHF